VTSSPVFKVLKSPDREGPRPLSSALATAAQPPFVSALLPPFSLDDRHGLVRRASLAKSRLFVAETPERAEEEKAPGGLYSFGHDLDDIYYDSDPGECARTRTGHGAPESPRRRARRASRKRSGTVRTTAIGTDASRKPSR